MPDHRAVDNRAAGLLPLRQSRQAGRAEPAPGLPNRRRGAPRRGESGFTEQQPVGDAGSDLAANDAGDVAWPARIILNRRDVRSSPSTENDNRWRAVKSIEGLTRAAAAAERDWRYAKARTIGRSGEGAPAGGVPANGLRDRLVGDTDLERDGMVGMAAATHVGRLEGDPLVRRRVRGSNNRKLQREARQGASTFLPGPPLPSEP